MFFRFCCFVSRLLSRELSGAYVLTIFLYSFTSVVNAQQLASIIEPLPAPMSGEYRSVKDGVWNDAATWQEWTGTEWAHASTLPSEAFLITPVVKGWNISTKMGGGDIHTINLPADIETGDLLLIFWTGAQADGRNVSRPPGFIQLYFADGGNRRRTAWYKVATGAEGQTIDVIAGTGVSAHTSYRIAAGTYSSVPVAGVVVTGHNSSPDPPVLNTGLGLVPTLWIATSHSDGNGSASSPSGYPPPITAYTGSVGNNGARTAITHLVTTNTTSHNPGAFSLDQNSSWAANTIAVQGAFRKAVVRNEHTVTVTNNVAVSDVDVYGSLDVNTNTAMTIAGNSTLTVHEDGRLRLPGNNTAGNDARIAGAGNFILSEGGYLEIGSLNGITSSGTTPSYGNIRVSGARTFHVGAHYIYNRNGLANNNQSTGTGYPTNLTGSLTIDNPSTVTRTTSSSRNISTGILYLVKGTFAAGGVGFTMGNNTSSPNGTIVRTGGIFIGGVGSNWHQVIYKGDSKTTGPELLGNGLRNINVDLLDKSQVLTLNTNITIPGSLTLAMGLMNTNSNTLTVSSYAAQAISGGSSDSFVQGNLVRGIASGTNTYNFPLGSDGIYAPVSLAFTANSINRNVTGSTTGSNHKKIASSGLADPKLERHWTFSATGGGSYNYNPMFSWDRADEEDGFEFNNAIVARYDGSTWTYPTMSDKAVNSAKAKGLNGFGDFQLGSEDMTPDAGKSSIKANRSSDVVANNMDASIVTVTVRNSNGNPVGAGVDVFLRVTEGSVGDGGLNPSDSWKTDVDGQVEVNLTSTVANNVEVIGYLGTDDDGEWIGGDKINATVEVNFNAGAATSLAIVTQPVGRASGSTMAAQPVIHILDANDNVVTEDSATEVTVAITSGDGGALGGTLSVIADGGVATFNSLTLAGTVGETYGLTFVSEGLAETVSEGVKLSSHGCAAQIALSGLISNLPSGDNRQLTATLKDGAGNLIDTGEESSLEITFSQSTELGSVSGLNTITAERGVALITIVGKNGGQVTVIASTESPTLADQLTFTITVDNTTLQAAIAETEDFIETDWSVDSWTVLQSAITNTRVVLNNINAAQLAVDAALAELKIAIADLEVDKAALEIMVTRAKEFIEVDWSVNGWAVLQTAILGAKTVLDDTISKQSEIDVALAQLNTAIADLDVDKVALQKALTGTEDLTQADWSVDSWAVLQAAILEVQAVLDDDNSKQSEINGAIAALNIAINDLYVDKSTLLATVALAETKVESDYSSVSWAQFAAALDVAEVALADIGATQSGVDNATAAVISALSALQSAQTIGTPTSLIGQGGDNQVSLTWSAPTGGDTVVGYQVEYSLDNGATWQSHGRGPSAGTEAVVRGLTNNRAYIFRVAAVNESGTGPYSAASSIIIPTIPIPDEDGELPQPVIGEAVVIADGKREDVVLEVVDSSVLRLRGDEFEMNLTSIDINGENVHISDINPVIRIIRGEGSMIRLTGYGYEPRTYISIYLFSQPILLGQTLVHSDGTFDSTLLLTEGLDVGLHTLQVNGLVGPATVENSLSVGALVVENTKQEISFDPLPEKNYGDAPFKLNASTSSKMPISFSVSGMDGLATDIVELLDDNTLKINKTGQVRITAIQIGSDIFDAASPVTQVLLISPRQVTSILAPDPLEVLYGTEFNALEKPTAVQINFSDGTQQSIPVIWEKSFYNPILLGDQRLAGSFELDEYSENRDNIKVELLIVIIENPVFIPNAFTPNGDGVNDVFIIRGLENYKQSDLSVFNRWGNEVYRNSNYRNTWDGGNLNEGTYYYRLSMRKGNDVQVYTGWVLIKR